jgi:hypothetical protein
VAAVLEPTVPTQAIAGVSAGTEAEITTCYPSIAATIWGQRIGRWCDALPLRTYGVPWPRLLLAIPLWLVFVPLFLTLALLLYALTKIFGKRYVLTNRGLYVRQMLGVRTFDQVPLVDIKDLIIEQSPGQ